MTHLITMLAAATLLVACGGSNNDGSPVASTTDWHADISGTGQFAGIRGTSDIVLASDGQSFAVTTEITNAIAGNSYPWHVHFGTCAATGAIVGAMVYPELVVAADGRAAASATVTAPLAAATPYSVNVHISADNLATIIACGDLVLQGGGGGGGGGGDDDDDGGGGY
ncbi:MAG TPA: hypothetical protein VIV40_02780 [Kofleriaceae bacterium]